MWGTKNTNGELIEKRLMKEMLKEEAYRYDNEW